MTVTFAYRRSNQVQGFYRVLCIIDLFGDVHSLCLICLFCNLKKVGRFMLLTLKEYLFDQIYIPDFFPSCICGKINYSCSVHQLWHLECIAVIMPLPSVNCHPLTVSN